MEVPGMECRGLRWKLRCVGGLTGMPGWSRRLGGVRGDWVTGGRASAPRASTPGIRGRTSAPSSGTLEMVKVLLVAGGTVMVMGPALEGKVVVSLVSWPWMVAGLARLLELVPAVTEPRPAMMGEAKESKMMKPWATLLGTPAN